MKNEFLYCNNILLQSYTLNNFTLNKGVTMRAKGCKKKNVYRHKNGYYSVIFYSTCIIHLSLEAEFYQVFGSYFKILVRLVVFDLW